jgi:hypothetical protein
MLVFCFALLRTLLFLSMVAVCIPFAFVVELLHAHAWFAVFAWQALVVHSVIQASLSFVLVFL